MSMILETKQFTDIESMADYEGIRDRFLAGFGQFVWQKKLQGAQSVIADEITHEALVRNADFHQAIAGRVEDEAVIEKRYIFLSVNPEMSV